MVKPAHSALSTFHQSSSDKFKYSRTESDQAHPGLRSAPHETHSLPVGERFAAPESTAEDNVVEARGVAK
jgi:hypothetical protein